MCDIDILQEWGEDVFFLIHKILKNLITLPLRNISAGRTFPSF